MVLYCIVLYRSELLEAATVRCGVVVEDEAHGGAAKG